MVITNKYIKALVVGLLVVLQLAIDSIMSSQVMQMAIAPLVMAGLTAAPGLISGINGLLGKDKYKKDEQYQQYQSLYNTLNKEIAKPYMETSGAQSVLAALREANKRQIRKVTAAQAINGMTDEAKIGAMGRVNEGEALAISSLGANADNYRQGLLSQKNNTLSAMFDIKNNIRSRSNKNSSNIGNMLNQGISGYLMSDGYNIGGGVAGSGPTLRLGN